MYKISELNKSERFALNRRRLGITGTKYGKKFGFTKNQVSGWERGKEIETIPPVVLHPKVSPGESLFLARRRKNFTVREMAGKMGVSHVTYIGWEGDRLSKESQARAIEYWNKKGWPELKNTK